MMEVSLSICIATLNRAGFIGETLDSIISQASEGIEIVILDGGSKDNTQEVVQERQRCFPAIRYFREATNGGLDRDFDRAVEKATGDYCWLMSDDDILKPGALAAVQAAMQKNSSLIVLNAEIRNADLSRLLQKRRLNVSADRYFGPDETDEFFAVAGAYLTFIGCVIIRRSLWQARERVSYYGTLFIHVAVIFQEKLPAGALILSSPLISIRYGNAMWTTRGFEIWIRKWPDLIESFSKISERAKARVYPHDRVTQFRRLVFFRAQGVYSLKEYESWIASDPRWSTLQQVAKLVALTPGVLINSAVCVYLQTFGRFRDPAYRVFLLDVGMSPYFPVQWLRKLFRR